MELAFLDSSCVRNRMDIQQLLGGVGEKEEYKHVHIKSGHLLKIRVIRVQSEKIQLRCAT
jgi:hypothetical protein